MKNFKLKTSLLFIPLIFAGLASCRPQLSVTDPVGLAFDQKKEVDLDKIKKLSDLSGARVFFWNVGWGHHNTDGSLDHNLIELAGSVARPDLMLLAEFKYTCISDQTKRTLDYHYPHRAFLKYDPTSEVGIAVFSTRPFTKSESEMLDWAPKGHPESARMDYVKSWKDATPNEVRFWDRSYSKLMFKIKGKIFNVVPLHLLEPWLAYNVRYGFWGVASSFLNGDNNPLRHQIVSVRDKLKRDFGNNFNDSPLLVIGDLNAPDKFAGLPSKIHKEMMAGFESIMPSFPMSQSTFPAISSDSAQSPPFDTISVTIDHALINSKLQWKGRAVLHLKGSDHYALYIVLDDK